MSTPQSFDVVIIGGGVAGLAAYSELAPKYSVCLLEAKGLFCGASGGSLRIMHSGLRYLKSLRLDLFLESRSAQEQIKERFPSLIEERKFVAQVPGVVAKLGRLLIHKKGAAAEVTTDTFLPVPNYLCWSEVLLRSPAAIGEHLAAPVGNSRVHQNSPVVEISGGNGADFKVVYRDVGRGGVKELISARVVLNCAGNAACGIDCASLNVDPRVFSKRPKFVRAWNIITSVPYSGAIFTVNGKDRMLVGAPREGELVVGTGYAESDGAWYVSAEERDELLKEFGLGRHVLKNVEGGMLAVRPGKGIRFLGADLINSDGDYLEAFAAKFVTFPVLGKKLANWVRSRLPA